MAADSSAGTHEPTSNAPPNLPGTDRRTLGKYELIRKIGAGGMGTVFLAVDTQLRRTVALKVLARERTSNPTLVKRFQAEAQAAAQLKHDNIVTVYDAGNAEGHLYIALEYVEGTDVYELVSRRGSIPIPRSIEIVKQVARALDHAHRQGIVHRDIKPSNLLLTKDGVVKLTDMGLARSIDETVETGITREGTTVGTVDYMAPEQARDSQSADIRSDIYSLGCTWYQMLTGSPPFPTGSVTNKLYAHVSKPRPDPRDINKQVPEAIVAVLHQMMARKAKDRYQTPAELLKDLENLDLRITREQSMVLQAITDTAGDETPDEPPAIPRSVEDSGRLRGDSGRLRGDSVRLPPPNANETPQPSSVPDARKDRRPLPARAGTPARAATPASSKAVSASLEPVSLPKKSLGGERKPSPNWSLEGIDLKRVAIVGGIILGMAAIGFLISSIGSQLNQPDLNTGLQTGIPQNGDDDSHVSQRRSVRGSDSPKPTKEVPGKKTVDAVVNQPKADAKGVSSATVERIPIGRTGEKERSPGWVAQIWDHSMQSGSAAKVMTRMVGRTDGPPSKFASLAEALEDLPKEGGIVELVGDGPFVLSHIHLEGREKVVVTAAENSRPVVLMAANPEIDDAPVLSMAGGTLILSDIHLFAVGEQFHGDQPRRLVNVEGGDLVVRNCSVTMQGTRETPLVAFRVSGSSAASSRPHGEPHVLLDRVLVRGENLAALDLNLPAVDLLASGCFFATGRAPVLRVTSTSDARGTALPRSIAKIPSGGDFTAARALRIFSCTSCSSRTAFEVTPGSDLTNPPATEVQVLNSIIACETGSKESVLISLRDWPDEIADSPRKSQLKNLGWTVEHSLTLGWNTLLQKDLGKNRAVREIIAWQQVWHNPADSVQFQPLPWPGREISDFVILNPGKLEVAVPGTQGIRATDGERPGCDLAKFVMPQPEIQTRASAYAERPVVPADLTGATAGMTRKIDLESSRSGDLGKAISAAGDWPSGTVFLVSGSGIKTSSPIRVEGKSLRIEFDEKSRGRLTIQAAPVDAKLGESNGEGAFLSVTQGSLELVHTHFKSQLSARKTETAWLVKVSDGNLSIHNSVLLGQLLSSPGDEGLIRWTATTTGGQNTTAGAIKTPAGVYQHYAHISESFLAARGSVFSVDARDRGVLVERSLCVSAGRLFDIHLAGNSPRFHGAFDVSGCTLSAGQAYFHIRGTDLGATSPVPMRFFVERNALAPPVTADNAASQAPDVVVCDQFKPADGQIEWWENANGYSVDLTRMLLTTSLPEKPETTKVLRSDWAGYWGAGHVQRPLLDDDGLLLSNTKLAKLTELSADEFRLLPNSKATTWTADGSSIGVNVDALPVLALKGGIPKPAPKPTKVEKSKPAKKATTF